MTDGETLLNFVKKKKKFMTNICERIHKTEIWTQTYRHNTDHSLSPLPSSLTDMYEGGGGEKI